jgi:biopolymer transport protein ExbB
MEFNKMDINTFLKDGGIIVYILIFINIVGFSIILIKIINIIQMKKKIIIIVNNISQQIIAEQSKEKHIENLIDIHIKPFESGLNTIKNIATIAPLLGLLGTVIGILLSFNTISKVGLDDPTVFSSSISLALITTVAGLIVSIPHYVFYNYYIGVLEKTYVKIYNQIIEKL